MGGNIEPGLQSSLATIPKILGGINFWSAFLGSLPPGGHRLQVQHDYHCGHACMRRGPFSGPRREHNTDPSRAGEGALGSASKASARIEHKICAAIKPHFVRTTKTSTVLQRWNCSDNAHPTATLGNRNNEWRTSCGQQKHRMETRQRRRKTEQQKTETNMDMLICSVSFQF